MWFTADPIKAPLIRLLIAPTDHNGLVEPSRLMADKVATVPKTRLRRRIGRLSAADLSRLDRALLTVLGLVE